MANFEFHNFPHSQFGQYNLLGGMVETISLEEHADALAARVEELTVALERCVEENEDLRNRHELESILMNHMDESHNQ